MNRLGVIWLLAILAGWAAVGLIVLFVWALAQGMLPWWWWLLAAFGLMVCLLPTDRHRR